MKFTLEHKTILLYGLITGIFSLGAFSLLYVIPEQYIVKGVEFKTYGSIWLILHIALCIAFLNTLYKGKAITNWIRPLVLTWITFAFGELIFFPMRNILFHNEFGLVTIPQAIKGIVLVPSFLLIVASFKIWQLKTQNTKGSIIYFFLVFIAIGLVFALIK